MTFSEACRKFSLKSTVPRRIVFDALSESPISFEKLRILAEVKGVDPSTVYRIVDTFEAHEMIVVTGSGSQRIIQFLGNEKESDIHHAHCTACGKITTFHDEELEHRIQDIAKTAGLEKITKHTVGIEGTCANC
jgi:Fur family ferric uptake transcriptional regulator